MQSIIESIKPQILHLVSEEKSKKDIITFITNSVGVTPRTAREWLGKNIKTEVKVPEPLTVKSKDVTSLEELLKVCNVNTDKYKIDKFNVKKNNIKDKDGDLVPRFDVEAFLSNKDGVDGEEILNYFIDNAKQHAPLKFEFSYPKTDSNKLLQLDLADTHIAKLGWHKETGEDYDAIIEEYGFSDDVIIAALFHDIVEDTKVSSAEISEKFGLEVGVLVSWVTDISKPSDGNRAQRKAIDRKHILSASSKAKAIKLADLIDNTKNIILYDKGFARIYLQEKKLILDSITDVHSGLLEEAWSTLNDAIEKL